jgi:hypothetical protein
MTSDYGIRAPWAITEERWWEMLEVLPPSKWRHSAGCESFHVCEYLSGNVVSWFVRLGEQYYELQDVDSLTPAELAAKCRALQVAA